MAFVHLNWSRGLRPSVSRTGRRVRAMRVERGNSEWLFLPREEAFSLAIDDFAAVGVKDLARHK